MQLLQTDYLDVGMIHYCDSMADWEVICKGGVLQYAVIPETVREHYAILEHHAKECIQCGACETRCPFEVSIMDNMKRAAEIFGK